VVVLDDEFDVEDERREPTATTTTAGVTVAIQKSRVRGTKPS
jgi:hypothetical protein